MGELGERIRARRAELGWSQEHATQQCGVHWTHMGQVECGQRSARVENLLKLSAGLQTTPGQLLDGLRQPE
ncbi:helix-turn-helix transcriptional regulator [Rhodococcus qingshengii]|uniref:helix-turn-helix domain-containing protein n=1 Tax=Rhodococcus qingshengii TaxID=334542 RepID=UPI0030B9DD55